MKRQRHPLLPLVITTLVIATQLQAQNITNDTIYVSSGSVTEIVFPATSEADLPNGDGSYVVKGGTRTSLLIEAQKPSGEQLLIVTEGPRKHRFILSYKEGTPPRRLDWSDLKTLEAHVKEREKVNTVPKTAVMVNPGKESVKGAAPVAMKAESPSQVSEEKDVQAQQDSIIVPSTNNRTQKPEYKRQEAVLDSKDAAYQHLLQQARDLEGRVSTAPGYDSAIGAYKSALLIFPDRMFPTEKIKLLTQVRDSLQASHEAAYTAAISMGDSLFNRKELNKALDAYKQAATIRPEATYPKKQMGALEDELSRIESIKNDSIFRQGYKIVREQLAAKKFNEAMVTLEQLHRIRPSDDYVTQMLNNTKTQLAAKESAKTTLEPPKTATVSHVAVDSSTKTLPVTNNKLSQEAVQAADRNRVDKQPVATANPPGAPNVPGPGAASIDSANQSNAVLKNISTPVAPVDSLQREALPLTLDVLKAKYPDFDFTRRPPDQLFNQADDPKEHYNSIREILKESPRLQIQDSSHAITLICQGISFRGVNSYIKLLIKNNSDHDFLTGQMMLDWKKREGTLVSQKPVAIYPEFPVVLPGKQMAIVYALRKFLPADDEILYFVLNDRPKKSRLQLEISGSDYNKELNR